MMFITFSSFWFLFLINVFMFLLNPSLKKKKKAFETFEAKMESCNLLIVS